ncbi:hypothetical protein [Ammoniphilus sp. CFH 90114]|uniref:hypothetical protein n=1 Tax=Ammoniphilus sp. CFH 90114 TaxID=2493665 RepID=UPI0013E980EC|nr:hypothetical protein [Ammoniphilus sp. CFH 90114]
MRESFGWLSFTFFSSLFCFFWFDWIITITCFTSGLLVSIKAMISEYTDDEE